MTETEKNPREFLFCYNCGKRTNTKSDHGYVWRNRDGTGRYSQCQKCGDELTEAFKSLRIRINKLELDYGNDQFFN